MIRYSNTNLGTLSTAHSQRFQDDYLTTAENLYNQHGVTSNQALAGKPNPRTLIPPVMVPPTHDLDYWKDMPMTTHSQVNKKTPYYSSLAGYYTRPCPDENFQRQTAFPVDNNDNAYSEDTRRENFALPDEQRNLETQTLQPHVYERPEVHQPINANMGISITPQFPNTYKTTARNGGLMYVETDKDYSEPIIPRPELPNESNVFDPRFSGYGSDNRYYLDPLLQQPRYYYDDINAIRQPNYIVRSKLDSCVTPYGEDYGPMQRGALSLNEVKKLAQKSFMDNSIQFRNDLTERQMRKVNEEMEQRRKAPKYTTNQRML
jgi:hypothetical protein